MRALVTDSLDEVLRPLVYAEPVSLVAEHHANEEPCYVVSATLQEVVETIADDLGFDGALGTLCEIDAEGCYTGRALRALHADAKADAVRELAADESFELDACTAYTDSHTDLPLLEVVGFPVCVNPDRRLRRIAAERNWPVLRFRERHVAAA
jgi:HAD superfamily hydrolase (TIGR01490 family)